MALKKKTFHPVLAHIFSKEIKRIHRVKDIEVLSPGLTIKKRKSTLNFRLILNDYVDEKKLEDLINKTYQDSLNKVINEFEKYSYLYDYQEIEKSYKKFRKLEIEKTLDKLINSNLFKKYPPKTCYENKEYCLTVYTDFYTFIFEYLKKGNLDFKKFLDEEQIKNITFHEAYKDFNLNQKLFTNKNIRGLLNKSSGSFVQEKYFEEKFYRLLNSDFYSDYSFNYCMTYEMACLKNISEEFKKILHEHKIESENLYKVNYISDRENDKFQFLPILIKVLGFTILVTYILFVLTNKFFRAKLK